MPIVFNALAIFIVTLVTIVLVWGVKESARFNAVMVGVKLLVLAFFVLVSLKFVRTDNWHPFAPNGFSGIGAGAAIIFFAYIGFDAVSTCAEECKNPGRDMPIGIIGSLIACTIIYVIVAAVFSGLVPYTRLVQFDEGERAEALAMAMKYVHMPNWSSASWPWARSSRRRPCSSSSSSASPASSSPWPATGSCPPSSPACTPITARPTSRRS